MSKLPIIILAFILPSIYPYSIIDRPIIVDPINSGSLISLPPVASTSSKYSSSSNINYIDYIATDKPYGPFNIGDNDFLMSFNYRLNVTNQSIKERLRILNGDNQVVHSETKPIKSYTNNALNTVSFNIPINSYLSDKGLTVKFDLLNSGTNSIIKAYEAKFYPPKSQYINYQILKSQPYISQNLGLFANGTSFNGVYETIDFREIGDYLDVDYYYRLSLNKLCFSYSSLFALNYKSINLRFNDKEGLFPAIDHDINADIILPLVIKNNQGIVSFAFKNKFYVNKRTLQISDTFQTGFVLTSDFYLPINGKRFFNNKNLYIDIVELGADKMSTTISIKYDASKSLMGLCHDATHCLVGGMG